MERGAEKFPWWGVDGCKGGWLFVGLNEADEARYFVEGDIAAAYTKVRKLGGKTILIDIPIGFRCDKHERVCDKCARKLIGKRRSSVFRVPCRQAIEVLAETNSIEKARCMNYDVTCKVLSRQTWAIASKICQVDRFLSANPPARKVIREVHPEVCFRMLSGAQLEYNKKRKGGRLERWEILKNYLDEGEMKCLFDKIRSEGYKKKIVADDDINDALVAALTAKLGGSGDRELRTLPPRPSKGSCGLPVEMVFVCGDTGHCMAATGRTPG